jgi:hypothetical protein
MSIRGGIFAAVVGLALAGYWVLPGQAPSRQAAGKSEATTRGAVDLKPAEIDDESSNQGLAVPILIPGGAALLKLRVQPLIEAKVVVRVTGEKSKRPGELKWADLVRLAAFAGIEFMNRPPVGALIEVDTDGLEAAVNQMAPIALAIHLGLAGRSYPKNQLLVGALAPDGRVYSRLSADQIQDWAGTYGFDVMTDAALARAMSRSDPPLPPAEENVEANGLKDSARLRQSMSDAIGAVMARKPYSFELPDDMNTLESSAEVWMRSAPLNTQNDILEHAWQSAGLREAIRNLRFAAPRIHGFTLRTAVKREAMDEWRLGWLIQLLKARIGSERLLRERVQQIPTATGSSQLALPTAWLNKRSQRLQEVGHRFRTVLSALETGRAKQPRPYPWSDSRLLSWPASGIKNTRAAVADWGESHHHVAVMWTHFVVRMALKPLRMADSVEPEGIRIDDLKKLTSMLGREIEDASDRERVGALMTDWEARMRQRESHLLSRAMGK